jgi:hypothetical protein
MFENVAQFLLHWGITALSLWAASQIFNGVKFDNASSLVVSALLLGFASDHCLDDFAGSPSGQGLQGVQLLDGILCEHLHLPPQRRDGRFGQSGRPGNRNTNARRHDVAVTGFPLRKWLCCGAQLLQRRSSITFEFTQRKDFLAA